MLKGDTHWIHRLAISPDGKWLSSFARHNDIRLTLGVCTHTRICEQVAAIEAMGKPSEVGRRDVG